MRSVHALILVTVAACAVAAGAQAPQKVDPLSPLDGPDRDGWQQPDRIMDELGIADAAHVADLMAGAGWFSARLARRVGPNGVVTAVDTDRDLVQAIAREASQDDLPSIHPVLGTQTDPHLPGDLQAVLIVDAFGRLVHPVDMLRHVTAALAPDGRLGVVDFTKAGAGGPGPPVDQRIEPAVVVRDALEAGLTLERTGHFLRFEFLLVFVKTTGGGRSSVASDRPPSRLAGG